MENQELQSYSPQGLISQALAQGLPVETLERLMDLSERWEAKQAKTAFLRAMNQFQSKVPELIKSKKVDFPTKDGGGNVKYNYTPLSKISKTIQPILNECGVSYRWEFEDMPDGKIKCKCIVSHVAGHSEENTMTAAKDTTGKKNDIQSIGSTRQYLQRYTLIGVLGLSTADEDNDGRTSEKPKENIPAPQSTDKIEMLISKIHAKTKESDLSKLDSLIGNEEKLDKRKHYLGLFGKQLAKVGQTYVITTKAV